MNDFVIADDGTRIGYKIAGTGPGLLLVHGNASSSEDYDLVIPLLASHFTVYTMDRRGRGLSGPQGESYSMHLECTDVIAILQKTNCSNLFGHSYGALASLKVAANYPVEKLVLYDPPLFLKDIVNGIIPELYQALSVDDYVGAYMALVNGLEILHGVDCRTFEVYLRYTIMPSPAWPRIVQLMKSSEKEVVEAAKFSTDASDYAAILTRTLIIEGTENPGFVRQSAAFFEKNLPNAKLSRLHGQGHAAMLEAPSSLAQMIIDFCID